MKTAMAAAGVVARGAVSVPARAAPEHEIAAAKPAADKPEHAIVIAAAKPAAELWVSSPKKILARGHGCYAYGCGRWGASEAKRSGLILGP